jgi:hypothetical protein
MSDREKVIKGLDEITHYNGEQMLYNDIFIRGIADDAIALLKEQEPQLVLKNDKEFLAHIMTEICDYVIDHGEEPNDPLLVIADNIKALLERCSVNGWIEEDKS